MLMASDAAAWINSNKSNWDSHTHSFEAGENCVGSAVLRFPLVSGAAGCSEVFRSAQEHKREDDDQNESEGAYPP